MVVEMSVFNRDEFEKFRDFFYRKTGIWFDDKKFDFVERRIEERMSAVAYDSFRSYFAFLRMDFKGGEMEQLTNLLTVNETYFYREEYQFKCLVNSVLDEVARRKKPGEAIRIWSVPCSTGEEPYSIALYLLEHWPAINDRDVAIMASDIDTVVLSKAKRGIYGVRSLQNLPESVREHYFSARPGRDEWEISNDIKEAIEFSQVNLNDLQSHKQMRNFDVIFCRNVLIYFDEVSRRKVAEGLFDAMNPGGFILLGHSESMSRISPLFRVRKFPDAMIYQKPLTL
ncbi:MAG: protein-glutamate O-methyltransferase CheR [Magnetococcales bacterium]|nr:protein-glutamate O-methyltransferase CheR [Magnetococcales bacterium]MBF0114233.1 protein-glutamate O-methyltransferase CheR [Magnetococcales bacterium]